MYDEMKMSVFFQVQITEEYSAYDESNFVGDFGGYLGLLLGGSLPALIEIIEKAVYSLMKKCLGRSSKNEKSLPTDWDSFIA